MAKLAAIPLIEDLQAQAQPVRVLLFKALLLLGLFLCLDRLIGWWLRTGLERYYGLDGPAAVLCVGHSHTVLGIDKVLLEQRLGVPIAKFSVEGANTADRLRMIRYFFARHPGSVRAVVYDVDAHSFTESGLSSNSYELLFPFIDDSEIRAYVKQNCPSLTQYRLRRVLCTSRYNELLISLAARGHLKNWSNFKQGAIDVRRLENQLSPGRLRRIEFDRDNLQQFANTLNFVGGQGSALFLTYIPTIDLMNRAEPEKFAQAMEIFAQCAATNSQVRFLDYNKELQSRHELFFDSIHMNRRGQQEVTARLAMDLKPLLEQQALVSRERIETRTH